LTGQGCVRSGGVVSLLQSVIGKMRHFLMTKQGLNEDEAVSLMSVGVDFGVTQVVDGNWGVHAIVKKNLFTGGEI
jgi:acetamidase/formamidase